MIAEDGFMNATVGNTERMVCAMGWRFDDGSDHSDIICMADTFGVLQWQETIPDCEGNNLNACLSGLCL